MIHAHCKDCRTVCEPSGGVGSGRIPVLARLRGAGSARADPAGLQGTLQRKTCSGQTEGEMPGVAVGMGKGTGTSVEKVGSDLTF